MIPVEAQVSFQQLAYSRNTLKTEVAHLLLELAPLFATESLVAKQFPKYPTLVKVIFT